jgi:hypothetical protein
LILNERRQDHMFVARGERKCLFCNKWHREQNKETK